MKQLRQTENPTYRIVVALCKDYEHREREIAKQEKDRGTLMMLQPCGVSIVGKIKKFATIR